MKKFLIGIVTLVAAVMLSSPAFGGLTGYNWQDENLNYYTIDGVGTFSFDLHTRVIDDGQVQTTPDPDKVAPELIDWGWADGDITFSEKFEPLTGLTGDLDFNYPVQIVVAKWGGGPNPWAFLLDGYTTHFDWDLNDTGLDMSNVAGYNAVPVPAAVWLLGSGVLGLVAIRRRRS